MARYFGWMAVVVLCGLLTGCTMVITPVTQPTPGEGASTPEGSVPAAGGDTPTPADSAAATEVPGDLWYLVEVVDVPVVQDSLLSYQISGADADGGSIEVTISGDAPLRNCPGGTLTYRFDWHITGTDGDGIQTVRAGEAFSVEFDASATATPPCEPQRGVWIHSGGRIRVPDSSSDLFTQTGPPPPDTRFHPTVDGQTGPYQGPNVHEFVTTTRYTVSEIPRGLFIMEIYAAPWDDVVQIVYIFESEPGPATGG